MWVQYCINCNDRIISDAGVAPAELLAKGRNNTNRIFSVKLQQHSESPTQMQALKCSLHPAAQLAEETWCNSRRYSSVYAGTNLRSDILEANRSEMETSGVLVTLNKSVRHHAVLHGSLWVHLFCPQIVPFLIVDPFSGIPSVPWYRATEVNTLLYGGELWYYMCVKAVVIPIQCLQALQSYYNQ